MVFRPISWLQGVFRLLNGVERRNANSQFLLSEILFQMIFRLNHAWKCFLSSMHEIPSSQSEQKGETPHHSRERTDKETPDEEALLRKVWTRLNSAIRFISIAKHLER